MESKLEALLTLLNSTERIMREQGFELLLAYNDPELFSQLLASFRLDEFGHLHTRSRWNHDVHIRVLLNAPEGTRLPPVLRKTGLRLSVRWPISPRELSSLVSLSNLTTLAVRASGTASLDGLQELSNIRSLYLSQSNSVQFTPPGIGMMKRLHSLECRRIPPGIEHLRRLKHVVLRGTVETLAPLASVSNLETLEMTGQKNTKTLDHLDGKRSLWKLAIRGCGLKQLPVSVCNLPGLETLDLSYNQLTTLPTEIENLRALRDLSLDHNPIQSLPDRVSSLTTLEHLSVEFTRLQTLPDSMGLLKRMRVLRLGHNRLQQLPRTLMELECLEALFLSENDLRTLPFGLLPQTLQILHLSENRFDHIPVALWRSQVQDLRMANNRISSFVKGAVQNKALRRLDISGNRFQYIPGWVQNFVCLHTLNLKNNRLVTLPDTLGNMTSLRSLQLGNNPLRAFPARLGQLPLQFLGLSGVFCGDVPDFLKAFSTLRQLELRNCGLRKVPAVLAHLPGLQQLDLRDNPLDKDAARTLLASWLPNATIRL